jgi:hypothetical protein
MLKIVEQFMIYAFFPREGNAAVYLYLATMICGIYEVR